MIWMQRQVVRPMLLVGAWTAISTGAADALTLKSTDAATVTLWGALSIAPNPLHAVRIEIARVKTAGGVRPESFWRADKPATFWVAEKQVKIASGSGAIQWADSRDCPTLASTMDRFAAQGSVEAPSGGATISLSDFEALSACWLDQPPV